MFHNLKNAVQRVPRYETVLIELLEFCREALEQERYVLPSEKHSYLLVIPHLFLLIDQLSNDLTGKCFLR